MSSANVLYAVVEKFPQNQTALVVITSRNNKLQKLVAKYGKNYSSKYRFS